MRRQRERPEARGEQAAPLGRAEVAYYTKCAMKSCVVFATMSLVTRFEDLRIVLSLPSPDAHMPPLRRRPGWPQHKNHRCGEFLPIPIDRVQYIPSTRGPSPSPRGPVVACTQVCVLSSARDDTSISVRAAGVAGATRDLARRPAAPRFALARHPPGTGTATGAGAESRDTADSRGLGPWSSRKLARSREKSRFYVSPFTRSPRALFNL